MKDEIGAYEAKTRLPELLRAVKAGRRFTITNRGEAVADLVLDAAVTMSWLLGDTLQLARRYSLSAHDASYLELALRRGLPLATLDGNLRKAGNRAGVARFSPG